VVLLMPARLIERLPRSWALRRSWDHQRGVIATGLFALAVAIGALVLFLLLRKQTQIQAGDYMIAFSFGLGVWAGMVYLFPWLVYGVSAVPVLQRLRDRWPDCLKGWMPRVCAWHPRPPLTTRLPLYLPPVHRVRDAIDWSPRGSPRESMLRVAIAELFSDDNDSGDPWQSAGLKRWLWFWCAPVWGVYLALVLLVGAAYLGWLHAPLARGSVGLHLVAYLWLFYAVVFMRMEATRLNDWGTVSARTLDYLPPMLRHSVKRLTFVAPKLASIQGLGVFSLVYIAGATILNAMIRGLTQ